MQNFIKSTRSALVAASVLISLTCALAQEGSEKLLDINTLNKEGKKPVPIKQSPPVYPYAMSRAGLDGAVTVEFIIDRQGNVQNPYVVSSNNAWFERPAIDAIWGWKFKPGEMNGRPVNTRVTQRIEFNLEPAGESPNVWRVTKGKEHHKLPPDLQWETPPTPVLTLFPVYPFEQLKTGINGRARVAYIVGPKGHVILAKLQEATAPEFGQALLAMIDAWQFTPAKKKDGTPCFASLASEYEFKPTGRADVPVSETALKILRNLEKKPGALMTLEDLDVPLKPLSRRPPVYPTALKEAGQDGSAEIEFFVDQNGDAQLPRIVSSTATEFGYAAALAVATWRFEAPKKGGKAVVVRARIPIEFSFDKHGTETGKP